VFMGVGALLLRSVPIRLSRAQLTMPLLVYLANFAFGATITLTQLDTRFWIPTGLGVLVGVIPAVLCWWIAPTQPLNEIENFAILTQESTDSVLSATSK
jgi:hypothetical protein